MLESQGEETKELNIAEVDNSRIKIDTTYDFQELQDGNWQKAAARTCRHEDSLPLLRGIDVDGLSDEEELGRRNLKAEGGDIGTIPAKNRDDATDKQLKQSFTEDKPDPVAAQNLPRSPQKAEQNGSGTTLPKDQPESPQMNLPGILKVDMNQSMISTGSSVGVRKDPNREFFQMCLLSYKMNNQDLDEVMELENKRLYTKCTEQEKKQFYEFQDWIEKEVSKIRFKKVYQKNRQNLESRRKVE